MHRGGPSFFVWGREWGLFAFSLIVTIDALEHLGSRMTTTSEHPLRFLWWNTGLSPPVGRRQASQEDRAFVVNQLLDARRTVGWDVLGLAEVSDQDIEAILLGLHDSSLVPVDMGPRKQGRRTNDIALIFDQTHLTLADHASMDVRAKRINLKVGYRASFVVNGRNEVIHVTASHWPSRLMVAEDDVRRSYLGDALYRSLRGLAAEISPLAVVMGDFNDDPYSPSLSRHFLASRDRTLASQQNEIYYNPFWRALGESAHIADEKEGICGTYYYRSGIHTRWHTFDQIIFSSEFLQQKSQLNEANTRILTTPDLVKVLIDRRSIFDHLPVLGEVILRKEA